MQHYADLQWLSSHSQGSGPQTHSNHDEHVKEIEKGRDYLLEAWFSQDNSNPRVATNKDSLSKKKRDVSIVRQAR
jgi:predicted urease superfamily metal-dependent hydrolase